MYLLPKAITDWLRLRRSVIDNFALKLNKAAYFNKDEKKFELFKAPRGQNAVFYAQHSFEPTLIRAILARHDRSIIAIRGTQTVSFDATNTYRWVTGMGNASIYENGITLHHVYGIPYLPGSGIKGMFRTYLVSHYFEGDEIRAKTDPRFKAIFGMENEKEADDGLRGRVYFFDALPTMPPQVTPDIMNNHYQSYYDGKTPPGDWISPNPVMFLSIKGGTYRFHLGANDNKLPEGESKLEVGNTLLGCAKHYLEEAFSIQGFGAKTAIGYGRMNSIE